MDRAHTVIVGGGTAGCILAARLARAGTSVHLLEKGYHPNSFPSYSTTMPLQRVLLKHAALTRCTSSLRKLSYTRNLSEMIQVRHTTPQLSCKGRVLPYLTSNILGGDSVTQDDLTYTRPPKEEYDAWRIENWSGSACDTMLRDFEVSKETIDDDRCIAFADETFISPFTSAFMNSSVSEFFETSEGTSIGPHSKGVVSIPKMRIDPTEKTAISMYSQYITPVSGHSFFGQLLKIQCESTVKSIDFANDNTATSVKYIDSSGKTHQLACERVILCAGAFETPKILISSGIGSPSDVEVFGVPSRIPLSEVGKNLHDHVEICLKRTAKHPKTATPVFDPFVQRLIRAEWSLRSTGWGTTTLQGPRIYGKSSRSDGLSSVSDYGVFFRPYQSEATSNNLHGCTFDARVLRPVSRGKLSFSPAKEKGGETTTHVDPKYLSSAHDVTMLQEAVSNARTVSEAKPLGDMLFSQVEADETAPENIAAAATGCGQFGGTCALGTVLTPDWRVANTKNCYVCDSSAVPVPVSAGLSSTVMLMAHRFADSIGVDNRYV